MPEAPGGRTLATRLAAMAGVVWLICSASIGYLAYQQWTASQAYIAAGLDVGDLAITAAWNMFACVVALYFAGRLVFGPGRSALAWSVAFAGLVVVGTVAQVGSSVEPVFALITVTAIIAGVLSFVGRSAFTPRAIDQSPLAPKDDPATPPAAEAMPPAPPAPAAATLPAPPAFVLTPQPRPGVTQPILGVTQSEGPPATPSERSSPVLILSVIVTALLAVGAIAYVVGSGVGSSLVGRLGATPSPVVTPAPTPRPTPMVAVAGPVVFGLTYDPESFVITTPRTRFKATYPSIAWSATVPTPVAATPIAMTVSSLSDSGVETPLHTGILSISGLRGDRIAANTDLTSLVDHAPGTYVLRLTQGDLVLAEGTFTLVR